MGLHGSGKTTSTAKLGRLLKKRGYRPLLVACDVQRPAAIDQLEILAQREELSFYADRESKDVPAIGAAAPACPGGGGRTRPTRSFLTRPAGCRSTRASIGEVKTPSRPGSAGREVLLVVDGALGQEAVNVAKAFNDALACSPA